MVLLPSELFSSFWPRFSGTKPESKQGLPDCLFGTPSEQASKSQPRGKVPRQDAAQLLVISLPQPGPQHSCMLRIFTFQKSSPYLVWQFPNYTVRQEANPKLASSCMRIAALQHGSGAHQVRCPRTWRCDPSQSALHGSVFCGRNPSQVFWHFKRSVHLKLSQHF